MPESASRLADPTTGAGTAPASDPRLPPPGWNATARPYRRDAVPADLVLEAAAADPDAPALVVEGGVSHTYRDLVEEAAGLARLLGDLGVGPGDHVGIVGRHRPETVVAVLAVATAGAAFVPCHPDWPAERLHQVLSSVGARVLVGDVGDLARVDHHPRTVATLTDVVVLDAGTADEVRPDPAAPAGAADVRVAELVVRGRPSAVLEVSTGAATTLPLVGESVDLVSAVVGDPAHAADALSWADAHGVFADVVTGAPHDVARLLRGPYDTAVLAGAAELPGVAYLRRVLVALAGVVRPGGELVLAYPPGRGPLVAGHRLTDIAGASWAPGAEPDGRGAIVLRRTDAPPGSATDGPGVRVWTRADAPRVPLADVEVLGRPGDAAYVIFTSGSTGRPKGVACSNTALTNMLEWTTETFGVGAADRLLQVTSFCFDLSIYDVFGLLSAGGSVRMVPDDELAEPARVAEILQGEAITFWHSAPPLLAWVLPFLDPDRPSQALRLTFLAGDWIALSMPEEIRRTFPRTTIVNLGGATETTVWSTYHVVGGPDPARQSIPYGRPIANTRYYVLDARRRPVPVDEPGDLYAAGTSLALGYNGDPSQTAERFVPDPFVPGERMYAFGDRGRWRPDGELQFLGRVDHQVKIRGYRVELGEIEAVMAAVDGLREAVVVTVELAGQRSLAAFYTTRTPGVGTDLVLDALASRLPEYMVPARITALDELPLSANGKVDRAALAARAGAGP